MKRTFFLASASLLVAYTTVAHAQDRQPAPPPRIDGADATAATPQDGLQDIIVTAQRRSENLQKTALAISAVNAAQLTAAGVTNPNDLTKLVPSLQSGTSNGAFSSFFIRGVGKVTTNAQVDSAVLINLDGVSLARSSTANGFFYDLERVEVLKGPQGTLYGRNATGGAVNIITSKPKFGSTEGYADAEYGNYDAFRTSAALNVPLGDNVAIRAAGQIVSRDGYLTDGTQDEKSQAGRLTASLRLGERVRLLLSGDYYHLGGRGPGAVLLPFTDPGNRQIGLLDPRSIARQTAINVAFAGNTLPAPPTNTFIDEDVWGVSGQLEVDTGLGTITILPAYRETNPSFRTVSVQTTDQSDRASQFSVEARLTSSQQGPLKYVLGLYYLDEHVRSLLAANQGFNAAFRDVSTPTESYAPFARVNFSITPTLRIDGGIRYTHDRKSVTTGGYNVRILCLAGPTACLGGPTIPLGINTPSQIFTASGALIPAQPFGTKGNLLVALSAAGGDHATFSATTYHLGLEYDLAPRSLLYVSYDTGFKAGGFFSTIPQDPSTFGPETIQAYTVGMKNRLFDNKLQLNLELFYWRYKDQQVSYFSSDSLGGTILKTSNIGKSTIKGFEIDSQFAATKTTLLRGNVQYLDARNNQFVYRVVGLPNTGCSVSPVGGNQFDVDCSGKRPTLTSQWTVSVSGEQTIPLGNAGAIVLDVGTRYQSSYNAGFALLPSMEQKGYWSSDASVTYRPDGDRFSITGFVRNLENYSALAYASGATQTTAYIVGNLRPPRTYGIRGSVKF